MHTQIKQEDPRKEVLLAMLMADKEKKGYIMASELRSKLMKLGEKLTHKEGNSLADSEPSEEGEGISERAMLCTPLKVCRWPTDEWPRSMEAQVKMAEGWDGAKQNQRGQAEVDQGRGSAQRLTQLGF